MLQLTSLTEPCRPWSTSPLACLCPPLPLVPRPTSVSSSVSSKESYDWLAHFKAILLYPQGSLGSLYKSSWRNRWIVCPGGSSVAGGSKRIDTRTHQILGLPLAWFTLAICMPTTMALLSALCMPKWQRKMLRSQKPSRTTPSWTLLLPQTGQEA